jgi:hypothetical protein
LADLKWISDFLWESVEAAHRTTRELSKNPLWRGSCSTLDAALVFALPDHGTIAMVVHVGDGVVWTLNDHGLQRQVIEDTAVSPQALGADQDLKGELRRISLPPGTRLVLTSDGFEAGLRRSKKSASAEPIALASSIAATLLREGASSSEISHCLGALAAASSPDDVTVVTVG